MRSCVSVVLSTVRVQFQMQCRSITSAWSVQPHKVSPLGREIEGLILPYLFDIEISSRGFFHILN